MVCGGGVLRAPVEGVAHEETSFKELLKKGRENYTNTFHTV